MRLHCSRLLQILLSSFCLFGILNAKLIAETRLAPSLNEQLKIKQKDDRAETLYFITESTLNPDDQWQRKVYVSIRVNDNDAARDYGRLSISFNHYYSKLKLDFANSISPNGKISPVSDDATQIRVTGGGQDFYSDSSELVFSLPDINPGSILEFQYTQTSDVIAFPGLFSGRTTPYWFQSTIGRDGWRADFVHNYSYRLNLPKAQKIYTRTFSDYPQKASLSHSQDTDHYTWSASDLQGHYSEDWMPIARTFLPTLQYSTINDWSAVDQWAWSKIEDKLAETKALDEVIKSFKLKANASNEDKVKAVYSYLQNNIRYVFAHLGRGGYEPHPPAEVLNVKYGDCKDQSVLAVALLRQLGIEAYPALVETPRAGDSNTDTVSLIFDHMIVHIPKSEGTSTQWLDTTGERSMYPGVSNYLTEQNTLIINGKGGELGQIPNLGENYAQVSIDYFSDKNKLARAEIKIALSGMLEQNIRSWWIHSNDRDNTLSQYLNTLYSSYDSLTAELLNSENIWAPAEIKASFTFEDDQNDSRSFGTSSLQLIRMFYSIANLPLPETRKSEFYDKYPMTLEMKVTVHGNEELSPALVQSNDSINNEFFTLNYQAEMHDNNFEVTMLYDKEPLTLSTANYKHYYNAMQALTQEPVWLIKMLPNSEALRATKKANKLKQYSKDSAEFYIALARDLLEQGEFSKALEPAQKAVDLKVSNGEAWYILGMAQGFNSLIDESSRSFEKAESLGYFP